MVVDSKTVQEKTSADSKAIGFDYQYYYFLYELLQLHVGECIGYEVKDDVHIDKSNGTQILIQLKHSVETKADGTIINLTEKDEDLWKTISNWVDMINDSKDGRSTIELQLTYMKKTEFQLITNKSYTASNKLISELENYNEGLITITEFKIHLESLINKKSSKVDTYIQKLLRQEDKWLEVFLKKLSIEQNKDDLIERIKQKIKEKNVKNTRIEYVYDAVNSKLRTMIYQDVKKRKKVIISFDDYDRNFTHLFELGRSIKLPIKLVRNASVPSDYKKYIFIQQLLDNQLLFENDSDFEEDLIKIFTSKIEMYNHLMRWLQQGDITEDTIREFDDESITQWKNIFNRTYSSLKRRLQAIDLDKIGPEKLLDLASECYYETLKLKLSIDETDLNTTLSNGQFHLLSDKPIIGWGYNWKDKYTR